MSTSGDHSSTDWLMGFGGCCGFGYFGVPDLEFDFDVLAVDSDVEALVAELERAAAASKQWELIHEYTTSNAIGEA
jgi:hypothetical protein